MTEVRAPYVVVAGRVATLVRDCPDAALPVPACPQWSLQQTLAHLVGAADDVLTGNLTAAGRPEWTEQQVRDRASTPVADLLERWAQTAATVADLLPWHGPGGQLTFDALTHEYDLRAALHAPVDADDPIAVEVLDWVMPHWSAVLDRREAPGLTVRTAGRRWTAGTSQPAGTLAGTPYDVLRSLSGRRTAQQVQALVDAPLEAWWPAFRWGPLTPPTEPVEG